MTGATLAWMRRCIVSSWQQRLCCIPASALVSSFPRASLSLRQQTPPHIPSSHSRSCIAYDCHRMSSRKKSSSSSSSSGGSGSADGSQPQRRTSQKKNDSGGDGDAIHKRLDHVDPNAAAASSQPSPSATPLPQLASSPVSPPASPDAAISAVRPPSLFDTVLVVLLLIIPAGLIAFGLRDERTKFQLAFNALLSVGAYFAVVRLIPMSVAAGSNNQLAEITCSWVAC